MKILFLSALILTGCYGPSSDGIANAESTKSFSGPGSYPLQLFAGYGSAVVCSNQNDDYKCWRSNNSDKWTQITSANPLSKNGYSAFYASSDGSMLCGQKARLTRCFPTRSYATCNLKSLDVCGTKYGVRSRLLTCITI